MSNRLHVGNLAVTTTAATLTEVFQRDGRTARVSLVMSREPGVSRGFAFVDMATEAEASSAMAALQGVEVDGRAMRVSVAHGPKSRFGGTVGGNGGPVQAPTAASMAASSAPGVGQA